MIHQLRVVRAADLALAKGMFTIFVCIVLIVLDMVGIHFPDPNRVTLTGG